VRGGVVGVIVDARGRPFALPDEKARRIAKLAEWTQALGLYANRSGAASAAAATDSAAAGRARA
jgi:hypothetical protein